MAFVVVMDGAQASFLNPLPTIPWDPNIIEIVAICKNYFDPSHLDDYNWWLEPPPVVDQQCYLDLSASPDEDNTYTDISLLPAFYFT